MVRKIQFDLVQSCCFPSFLVFKALWLYRLKSFLNREHAFPLRQSNTRQQTFFCKKLSIAKNRRSQFCRLHLSLTNLLNLDLMTLLWMFFLSLILFGQSVNKSFYARTLKRTNRIAVIRLITSEVIMWVKLFAKACAGLPPFPQSTMNIILYEHAHCLV